MQPLQQLPAVGWDLSIPKGICKALQGAGRGPGMPTSKGFGSRAVGRSGLEMWLQLETENVLVDLRLRWRIPGQCCARTVMPREAALCRAHTAPGVREVQLICPSC